MDPLNRKIGELEKMLRERILAFRERVARSTPGMRIPRVFSNIDDTDLDDAPEGLVGARLHPRHPVGGSASELPEPDGDVPTEAVGVRRRYCRSRRVLASDVGSHNPCDRLETAVGPKHEDV